MKTEEIAEILMQSENLAASVQILDEYKNKAVKAALEEAAENAQVLSWGQPVFSQSLTVDRESILSLIPAK